jgi:hypothetical protein
MSIFQFLDIILCGQTHNLTFLIVSMRGDKDAAGLIGTLLLYLAML